MYSVSIVSGAVAGPADMAVNKATLLSIQSSEKQMII